MLIARKYAFLFCCLAGIMLKRKFGGLLLLLTLIEKLEMDTKSGSVLPTTPRIKGISMVSATRWHTNGKFSNSMRYHT